MPRLVLPDPRLQRSFLEAMDEFAAEGARESLTDEWIATYAPAWTDPAVFAAFCSELRSQATPDAPLPQGRVPSTTLWWVQAGGAEGAGDDDEEEYLGRISIRHRLNDFLLAVGGRIGYDVRPTRRRRGHATAMLGAALVHAHDVGIDSALLTCDDGNEGSIAVIESHGGVLEDVRQGKRRYWVPTAS